MPLVGGKIFDPAANASARVHHQRVTGVSVIGTRPLQRVANDSRFATPRPPGLRRNPGVEFVVNDYGNRSHEFSVRPNCRIDDTHLRLIFNGLG